MPTSERVLVTGATGNAGREVVRALAQRDLPVRAGVRAPERAADVLGAGVELARLDFTDPSTWDAAIEGTGGVFLLRPPAIAKVETTLNRFVDRARERGAEHVVFLSVAGAGRNKLVPHHDVEVHLQASAAAYTILRPGFFAQNLQAAYLRDIREDDRIYVPAAGGLAAFVDLRDVAEVAAAAFADPDTHAHQAYTLTGPEPVSFREVAAILTEILGREIQYQPASIAGYIQHLRGRGLGWAHALVQTVLHVGLRFGQAERIDPTLAQLLGRRPRSVEEYIRDHVDVWR